MQTMQKMIDLLKPGDKRRENFRYKRLFRTGWYKIEENDSFEDSVSDCVRKVVKELLKKRNSTSETNGKGGMDRSVISYAPQ